MRWLGASRRWRVVFWCYAALLFIGTHTPGINIGAKIRLDLVIHLGAFGGWAALLMLSAHFGDWGSWRNARTVWPIAVVYAAVDESLQAIPFVHRHAAVDDWVANVCGITLATAGMLVLGRWLRNNPDAGP